MDSSKLSMAFVPAPIATALSQISSNWTGNTPAQKTFIEEYLKTLIDNAYQLEAYSKACANFDVKVVNDFLAKEGFDIRLQEGSPSDIYVAGVFRALVQWISKGYTETITDDYGFVHQGVIIEEGVTFWGDPDNPLVRLETKDENVIVLMRMEEAPTNPFKLCRLPTDATSYVPDYGRVLFPKIDFNQETNVDWIVGMTALPEGTINQAVQQDKLRLNEKGAAAESVFAAAISLSISDDFEEPTSLFVINRPFRLWVVVKGLPFAVGGYWLNAEVWADPGDIDF